MLKHLSIKNIALIENVEIEFENGLNIMTGETGAGKSIIIDSLMAILGNRTRREIIRTGTKQAEVEALFLINDEEFLLSREISQNSSTCRINGRVVTAAMMKEYGEKLVDIHGQHDSQSLLNTDCHIELLDSFAGSEIKACKAKYRELLKKYNDLKTLLKKLSGNESDRKRKLDFIQFEINEIEEKNLKENEEEELLKEKKLLSNSEFILKILGNVYNNINSDEDTNALLMLNDSINSLSGIINLDKKYEEIYKRLENTVFELEDISSAARSYVENVDYNPERLDFINERLDIISRLKKKYGGSVQDILSYMQDRIKELEVLKESEKKAAELEGEIKKIESELLELAVKINALRNKAGEILNTRIIEELSELCMNNTVFNAGIEFTYDAESVNHNFFENGMDKVEFLISTNPGEPLKPLSKIASGGEMSRIMLAIKTVLAKVDSIPTLIFDEIDIGISGTTADKVGESLAKLSESHQVICVTHLAQIASKANRNYLISKEVDDKRAVTHVKKLTKDETVNEIARILAGSNITDITKEHAKEMLGER
jgi:DNA repair protein RecN (Recombination protein N)